MIAHIDGLLESAEPGQAVVSVGGLGFQILVPEPVGRRLQARVGQQVRLHTICYLQGQGMNQLQPLLLGFERIAEREFFQLLITVDGVGPRAALRLMTEPVERIAAAIEGEDREFLQRLPGVGRQKAGEIVAKLQGKVAAFAGDGSHAAGDSAPAAGPDVEEEVRGILLQLGYSLREARAMIADAQSRSGATDTESLIQEIFRRRQGAS